MAGPSHERSKVPTPRVANQAAVSAYAPLAAWLMAELAASPLLVASVPAATNLPIFFLAIPAGALSGCRAEARYHNRTRIGMP